MWENRRVVLAKRYIRAVWGGDPATAGSLMGEAIAFVDSAGGRIEGFDDCSKATRAFAALEPHCRVTISEAFERGDAVFLRVELAAADPRINGPYLLSLKIVDGKVDEWQTHRHDRMPFARELRRAMAAQQQAGNDRIDSRPVLR